MTEELKTIDTVDTSPFRKMVMTIGELPTSFVESMTYYECLAWLVNYLENTVIKAVNNNAEVSEELQAKFIELKSYVENYFDNLDVQEEINNKLDEMAEAGTLQEIITAYIQANAAWCFDTVAGMKLADNFINGSFAQTLGYHSKNDGGAALYKIRTITNDDVVDDMFIIELSDNTLIAELITLNGINVKQLGAYGDNSHDDTNVLRTAFAKNNSHIFIPTGTYLVNDQLFLGHRTSVSGNCASSEIKWSGEDTSEYIINIPITSEQCCIKDISIEGNFLANGIEDGYNNTGVISNRTHIINVRIFHCKIGMYLKAVGSLIDDCYINGEYPEGNTSRSLIGIYVDNTDNGISNTRIGGCSQYGIYNVKSATRITNVKTYLCGTGCYFKTEGISADCLESQENYNDNIVLDEVKGSRFDIMSGGAGVEWRGGAPLPLPSTLNSYSYLKIINSSHVQITGSFNSRATYGTRTWSCAGSIITIVNSIGINISASSNILNTNATVYPQLVNCDNLVGNTVMINGTEVINDLTKKDVTLVAGDGVTLHSQNGDIYDFTINNNNTSNQLVYFPYFECTHLAIFNTLSQALKLSSVNFRYTVDGTSYNIALTPLLGTISPSQSLYRVYADVPSILAANQTYQDFITQGKTIENKRIMLTGWLGSGTAVSSRSHIKGKIQVFYN